MNKLYSNRSIPIQQVDIQDHFWSPYVKLVKDVVIPYQYEALHDRIPDAAPSYAIRNFRIAAGREEGEFGGLVFQDSDVAKWLEAVGHALSTEPNPELEEMADEVIDLIGEAQAEDGYLNTYYTIKESGNRWTNLQECHELYCAGHMIEAAVAYYKATGKSKLIDIMNRFIDHIDSIFGPEPDKLQGYDGHQEIELALVKLYEVTGKEQHLRLSEFFINERGKKPNFFDEELKRRNGKTHWNPNYDPGPPYNQSHLPVREQKVAVGHAVRAVYMYSGMADVAAHTGDTELYEACKTLWNNVMTKQMYITGGIGSTQLGEAFTFDYELPNDTVYAETCASIGLIFFAQRMLQIEAKREYADVLERALYDTVISGISLDGRHYFYVNPLEVWPEASEKSITKKHVKATRQKWSGCSCCPPNIARLLASLGEYIYSANDDTVYAHLYISGQAEVSLQGQKITLRQESQYPQDGRIKLTIDTQNKQPITLALRIPGWCHQPELRINGETVDLSTHMRDGYAYVKRTWNAGDQIELNLPMESELIEAHPYVRADAGKVAIQRGPLVYCLEELDNFNPLSSVIMPVNVELKDKYDEELFDGTVVIHAEAFQETLEGWEEDQLYRPVNKQTTPVTIKAVPYYLWGNRGIGEMQVWLRTSLRS